MPGRTRKEIEKAHRLNKQVRKEKARLRKRVRKPSKPVKYVTMQISFADLSEKSRTAILVYASKHKCSVEKAGQRLISKALKLAMQRDYKMMKDKRNGIS